MINYLKDCHSSETHCGVACGIIISCLLFLLKCFVVVRVLFTSIHKHNDALVILKECVIVIIHPGRLQ